MDCKESNINGNMGIFNKIFNIEETINNMFSSAHIIKDSVTFFVVLTIIYLILMIVTGIRISNALDSFF